MELRTEIRKQIEDLENQIPRTIQEFEEREDEINLLLDHLINPLAQSMGETMNG